MGRPRGLVTLAGAAVAVALGLSAVPASAQEATPTPNARFGERDEFIVSVERLFGFQNQKFSDDGGTAESTGFHPLYWGGLGLFSMSSSGLNFGLLLGATRYQFDLGGSEIAVNVFQLRPRVGYGGTEKEGRFGYWLRVGPNALVVFSKDEDTSSTGQTTSDSGESYAFGIGGEAYAVFFPAPHVGLVAGPHAEFHLAGGGDGDPYYRAYGLTVGIMGEFY